MLQIVIKIALTTVLVVVISETARRSTFIGGLIASLPMTSILAMIWLYAEEKNPDRVSRLSMSIFWLVLPSLVLFVLLPLLLRRHVPFAASLGLASAATIGCYAVMIWTLNRAGVAL